MVTTVDLTQAEIDALKELTNQDDAGAAIRTATLDYLRYARRIQLKQLSGRIEMVNNWGKLEDAELNSSGGTNAGSD